MDKTQIIGYIAIIVIVISLASIGMKLTGFATTTDTAVVNVTILSSAAINFTTDFINFGAGAVNAGAANATIDTLGINTGGNWSDSPTSNLTLENIGNINLSLALKSDKNADSFIGGTNPLFQFRLFNDTEISSCEGNNVSAVWTNFTTTDRVVCTVFPYDDSKDQVAIAIHLVIPYNSLSGTTAQTATITATGTYA